ncbi:uncharacterized protein LOC133173956 [Saccostrea echinata]|uniref:uncharacterized protein LOC133173956 n=1 Tax=Saccostrea echinata TaxID=191078 RepID=UPI002A7EF5A1|nr:uncharacterized protein LOC133173956 [Saccostrea echinata]
MKNSFGFFLLLFGAFYHDCRCRPLQSCAIKEVSENTSINVHVSCKEETIPDKICHKDIISGLCVAPPDCALRNVQVKRLGNSLREVSWTVTHNSTETGGYLVEYPADIAWSDTVCKSVIVNSNTNFHGTFSTSFRISNNLTPTVKPLWKMLNKKDNLRGTNIQNPNATFLKISFEVWTSTSHKYNIELWGSNNKFFQSKTVGKIRILDESCNCDCFNSKHCSRYPDWTTSIFLHPSSPAEQEPKKDHYLLVILVLVVIFTLILAILGIALLVACQKTMSEKQWNKNYDSNYKNVLLYAAKENKYHVNAVINLQNYISNVFKRHVNYTFINRQDMNCQQKFSFPGGTLNVIILSKSLTWCLQYIKNLPLKQRRKLIFVTMAVDCDKNFTYPANITIFHLHKDIGTFHSFLSNLFLQNQTKQDFTIAENRRRLKAALTDLNKFLRNNSHTSGTFQTKALLTKRPDSSFDSISKILTIYRKRKTFCNKRMFGFQMTSNGSEHIVLPGEFTFTDDVDTASTQEELRSCLDLKEDRSEEKKHKIDLKEGMAPMYLTNTMDEHRSPLLSGWEQRSGDIEAISLGGKSV